MMVSTPVAPPLVGQRCALMLVVSYPQSQKVAAGRPCTTETIAALATLSLTSTKKL